MDWAAERTASALGGEERHARRRRSALRTPAFVDRMDMADDAAGRVAIFTADGRPEPADPGGAALRSRALRGALDRAGVWLDGTYGGVAVAMVLMAVLVVGLLLSRH